MAVLSSAAKPVSRGYLTKVPNNFSYTSINCVKENPMRRKNTDTHAGFT